MTDDRPPIAPGSCCAARTTPTCTSRPDVVERIIDDISLARKFQELGMAGFVLKSHYGSTAERAAVVRAAVPGVRRARRDRAEPGRRRHQPARGRDRRARGRPHRLAADRRLGQRVARARGAAGGQGAGVGQAPARVCASRGSRSRRCRSSTSTARSLPEVREVLGMIARHGMCLATGHLSRDEIFAVVDAAVEAGVETIVITHPEFPSQDLSVEDQNALADKGALLERCFTTPHTGKVTWERWTREHSRHRTRALGPVDRSRAGVQPAGRGRDGADGRPAARRRLQAKRRYT